MIRLIGPLTSSVGSGGAGSATANGNSANVVSGRVLGIYLRYNDSPPAGTTDVTIATKGTAPYAPSVTLLSIANAATDKWFYPRAQVCNTSGVELLYATDMIQAEAIPIHDFVNVKIAQANDGDSVDAWLLVED